MFARGGKMMSTIEHQNSDSATPPAIPCGFEVAVRWGSDSAILTVTAPLIVAPILSPDVVPMRTTSCAYSGGYESVGYASMTKIGLNNRAAN